MGAAIISSLPSIAISAVCSFICGIVLYKYKKRDKKRDAEYRERDRARDAEYKEQEKALAKFRVHLYSAIKANYGLAKESAHAIEKLDPDHKAHNSRFEAALAFATTTNHELQDFMAIEGVKRIGSERP